MKKTLFLILSGVTTLFSIISICSGPIISKTIPNSINWRIKNCQKLSDEYDDLKEKNSNDKDAIEKAKKERNKCNREKAMYGLEYSSLIIDLVCGLVCSTLGLMHYFDLAKSFEKVTGIIGFSSGIIGFVITLVYVSYSGYIFTNHPYEDSNGKNEIYKRDDDLIFAKRFNSTHFKCLFFKDKDADSVFATYSDLGKKIYNYDKKKFQEIQDEESNFYECSTERYFPSMCISTEYTKVSSDCDAYYIAPDGKIENKYLFDKWITSIIFTCLIIVCDIGLAIFGFLLFKSDGSGI